MSLSAELPSLDLASLRSAYREGSLTPRKLVDRLASRLDTADPKIWIQRTSKKSLRERAKALSTLDAGSLPLFGVPFAIKDNLDQAGVPTSAACPDFAYTPDASAPVVERLLAAGGILVGKTNLDQFATGLVGVRSPYGVPENPFDKRFVPGGSSSGSAVAVAAGLVSFALGTDTAGSGRVPAAFNNLIGHKPTRGWLSTRGVVPACRTLDCVSIFALTAADAATVLDQAAAFDAEDPYSRRVQDPVEVDGDGGSFRFAVPSRGLLKFFGAESNQAVFEKARERLRDLGGQEVKVDFSPFFEAARLLYEGPWVTERFVAIRSFLEERPESVHPVTRRIIEGGAVPSAADAFEASYRLQALKRRAEAAWEAADVLVTPTAGRIFSLDEVAAEPVKRNSDLGYYTNFMNLLDLAAVAVPAGRGYRRLPSGITLFAPAHSDRGLLRLADRFHRCQKGLRLGATDTRLSATPALTEATAVPDDWIRLAVCGAHLKGFPLHSQLETLGARLVATTRTADCYRFFALADTQPAKPGLVREEDASQGASIEIEVYALSPEGFGRFVSQVPAPLVIGKVETAAGEWVSGFLCEPRAVSQAEEITALGGWREYRRTLGKRKGR